MNITTLLLLWGGLSYLVGAAVSIDLATTKCPGEEPLRWWEVVVIMLFWPIVIAAFYLEDQPWRRR